MVMSKLNKKASASFTGLTVKQKTALTGAGLKPIIKGEGGENKFVTLKNGLRLPLPEGWDVKKALHVNHLELNTKGLEKIHVPVSQVEQYYGKAPEVYSEDATGLRRMAYIRHDNCDLDWMVNLENPSPLRNTNPFDVLKALCRIVGVTLVKRH